MALAPMAPDGQWIRTSPSVPPVYVRHEAHIKRLLMDGGTIIADPRQEIDALAQQQAAPVTTETALRAEIDELKALVQSLVAQKSEQNDVSTTNDEPVDQPGQTDDRGPRRRKPTV